MVPRKMRLGEDAGLFSSDYVKSNVMQFLERHKNNNLYVILYVPETLGGCSSKFKVTPKCPLDKCKCLYQDYIDVTNSNADWVGLMIWQHKVPQDCTMGDGYKCVSCQISGDRRAQTEGKKYSSAAYPNSMKYGKEFSEAAPRWFNIHNSGSARNTSTIYTKREWINENDPSVIDFKNRYNCIFVFDST